MTKEDAMDYLARCADGSDPHFDAAVDLAVSALRAQAKEEKNDPLTMEELREMDGEPAWVAPLDGWGLVDTQLRRVVTTVGDFDLKDYGTTGVLFRHKPEEVTENG